MPEASEKLERIEFSLVASLAVGVFIRRVSSTNWLCEGAVFRLWSGSPSSVPSRTAAFRYRPRPSAIITKRKGERGSPCLIPLVERKGREGVPLTRIEKKEEVVSLRIQSTQFFEKPKESKTDLRYCQLNLSKDFERSSCSAC